VQGFELEVLKGGSRFLQSSPPLMMEIDTYLLEKKSSTSEELYEQLRKHYTGFYDLGTTVPKLIAISDFVNFYQNLKDSQIEHKDALFINNAN